MKFLRTAPTKRLLAVLAAVVAVVALGTTIAIAASGDGPKPPPKPLPNAVHDALTAPEVPGITARVEFKNGLIDSSELAHGAGNPVLTGASGRLWLSPGNGVRLELQSENGDVQVVANKQDFWAYDGNSNTVYKGDVPDHHGDHKHGDHAVPTVAKIERNIERADRHGAQISGASPSDVAGQPTYTVRVSPKRHGGLLGAGELAWDAARGVPLKVAVYAKGSSDPVLELSATDVSYGKVDSSNFEISPPADAKVVEVMPKDGKGHGKGEHGKPVTGVDAVSAKLDFPLAAPDSLAGMQRSEVQLLDWKKHPAALVTYGVGLDGVAVIEQDAKAVKDDAKQDANADGDHHSQLELPTVDVNGVDAQKLSTPLGTGLTFERNGVRYTVIGSLPSEQVEAAARGL